MGWYNLIEQFYYIVKRNPSDITADYIYKKSTLPNGNYNLQQIILLLSEDGKFTLP